MITGPLFKWFGSKWSTSKHYPAPKHDYIVEPFAGGAGYSLRHHERKVILAENNKSIYVLWKWLIEEASENAIREIPVDIPIGTDIRSMGLSDGQALLLKNWQRTNNISDGPGTWAVSKWGNLPGQWTANTRARVASEFHHVRHWRIMTDGVSVMKDVGDSVTWFVDPPYMYNYRYGCSSFDYKELGNLISDLNGQIIVCEAVCQKTGARPVWLPFADFRRTVTSRRKATDNHHSRELIYVIER